MNAAILILWLHILCMISVIGVLLCTQIALPREFRNSADCSRKIARLANILLGIGFLAGLGYYLLNHGYSMGPHYNGVIGVKFVFLLGAAAVIGVSKRIDNGDTLRWIALVLFTLASLFGITLP